MAVPMLERVSRDKGHPSAGIAARRTAGAPVTHRGNPLNSVTPPGGQWNCPLPRRCLAGERAGAYQPPLAGGGKGFPRSTFSRSPLVQGSPENNQGCGTSSKSRLPRQSSQGTKLPRLPPPFSTRKW